MPKVLDTRITLNYKQVRTLFMYLYCPLYISFNLNTEYPNNGNAVRTVLDKDKGNPTTVQQEILTHNENRS
jgi:hypothetical protein